jgi:regulator of protease activity HflC (stomatin/prohibitin superfamily)
MIFLIIGVVITIGLFVVFGFTEVEVEKTRWGNEKYIDKEVAWKCNKKQCIALLGLLICLGGCVTKIPANHVGIVYSPFGGTKETTLGEGFALKNPLDKVYKISTEDQTTTVKNLTTQTMDAQYVTSALDIKYRVNTANAYLIFKQYRTLENMSASLIQPTTQRVLELITTKYNVIDILGEKRSDIYGELEIALTKEFAKYGVEFRSISITDMDAGDKLEAAIEDEAVAKKAVETAEQNRIKAEKDAETKLVKAKAEKEANEILEKSLTDKILQQQWIEKWDGKLPAYYGGSDTGLMFNVGGEN